MKRMAAAAMGMRPASVVRADLGSSECAPPGAPSACEPRPGGAQAALLADSVAAAVIVFAVIPGVAWVAAMTGSAGSRIATVPAA